MKEKMVSKDRSVSKRYGVGQMLIISRGVGLGLGLGGILVPACGQGYFPTVNPFVDAPTADSSSSSYQPGMGASMRAQEVQGAGSQQDYNVKIGPVLARFSAGVTFIYQSNFNQVSVQGSASPQSLFTIGPSAGISLNYQVSDTATLMLSTGITYQKSLGQLRYDQFGIAPNSTLNYRFSVGDVQINLVNSSSTMNQATADPTISGTGAASLMEFNRLSNVSGLNVAWPLLKETTLGGGYSYSLNTSIGKDNFQQFDSGTHLFTLSVMQQLSPSLSLGVVGNGNILSYDSTSFSSQQGRLLSGQIQNGGSGWSVGPNLQWMLTQAIVASANLSYTSQRYDGAGLITDTSDFSGLTTSVSVSHQLSKSVSQMISGGRSVNPGNGSNFTESYTATYGLTWNYIKNSAIGLGFGFNRFAQSGAGFAYVPYDPASPPPIYLYINDNGIAVVPLSSAQVGQQYTASISTTYNITKKLIGGLSYSFVANILDQDFSVQSGAGMASFAGYQANNVILSLAYQF